MPQQFLNRSDIIPIRKQMGRERMAKRMAAGWLKHASTVRDSLIQHLRRVESQHDEDLRNGLGRVSLPNALDRKYQNAGKEWGLAVGVSGDPIAPPFSLSRLTSSRACSAVSFFITSSMQDFSVARVSEFSNTLP